MVFALWRLNESLVGGCCFEGQWLRVVCKEEAQQVYLRQSLGLKQSFKCFQGFLQCYQSSAAPLPVENPDDKMGQHLRPGNRRKRKLCCVL